MEYVLRIITWPKLTVDAIVRPFILVFRHLHDHVIPHPRNHFRPHLLRGRALALFAILLLSAKIFTLSALAFTPAGQAFSSAISRENILSLTNFSRKAFGVSTLSENTKLTQAAQAKANDMQQKAYFAHTSPEGLKAWNFIENAGYSYLVAGENLAINFYSADNMEEAWMNSPSHKANILNKNFEETGIGISQGEYGGRHAVFVVQMFGVAAEQNIHLTNSPTKVQQGLVPEPELSSALEQKTLQISDLNTAMNAGKITVSANISGPAVKVLAKFGERAVLLRPVNEQGLWQGEILVLSLGEKQLESLSVEALDIDNKSARAEAGSFSSGVKDNYNLLSSPLPQTAEVLGVSFAPKVFEQKMVLIFLAGILTVLALAIGVRKAILPMAIVAKPSLIVMLFACVLLSA